MERKNETHERNTIVFGGSVNGNKRQDQERIDTQGQESMVTNRKEPLQNWMFAAWFSLPVGTIVGELIVVDNLAWQGVRVLIACLCITGARKADVALDTNISFGLRRLSMWHAVWSIRGVITASPTREQLLSLCADCYVFLTPVPCKNDQDGTIYGGTPTPARYSATATVNFAREFAHYELTREVPADKRRASPLLLGPDGANPWRKRQLDGFFGKLLLTIMTAAEAKQYSLHSFRIYLA